MKILTFIRCLSDEPLLPRFLRNPLGGSLFSKMRNCGSGKTKEAEVTGWLG
jgi:hypothetical protein